MNQNPQCFFIRFHRFFDIQSMISLDSVDGFLMQDSALETLSVVDYTIKITAQKFWNFIAKFGSKAEIC